MASNVVRSLPQVRTLTLSLKISFDIARRWLFPVVQDAHDVAPEYKPVTSWLDGSLNDEQKVRRLRIYQEMPDLQKHAVSSVVSYRHRMPYLISGPPGTGAFH